MTEAGSDIPDTPLTPDTELPPPGTDLLADRAGHWELDRHGSTVAFRHKTYWGLMTVRGRFAEVSGAADVGPDGSVQGRVEVLVASLDTRNNQRDRHLRSSDFFNNAEYPHLVVTISRAVVDPSEPDEQVILDGELQTAGVTRPVTITARVTDVTADSATLQAEVVVNRAEFSMTWNRLGMLKGDATAAVVLRFTRTAGI